MQTKLTLRMDDRLIRFAKKYSAETGQSVSKMVADYFQGLEAKRNGGEEEVGPITKSLNGAFEGGEDDPEAYTDYLMEKYK